MYLNYNIDVSEVRKREKKTSHSKFQEACLLLQLLNPLSYLDPHLHFLLIDCNFYFKPSLNVGLCENNASSPDRANIWICLL